MEDTLSGRLSWGDRALGHLLTVTVQAGDVILFAEVSRWPARTPEVGCAGGPHLGYLAKGISKLAIAKLVECSPTTLSAWLARRNLRPRRSVAAALGME